MKGNDEHWQKITSLPQNVSIYALRIKIINSSIIHHVISIDVNIYTTCLTRGCKVRRIIEIKSNLNHTVFGGTLSKNKSYVNRALFYSGVRNLIIMQLDNVVVLFFYLMTEIIQ